jgi:SNF2 family DNA or RNA helicase
MKLSSEKEYKFKTLPFEHQKDAINKAYQKDAFAFFMEMGTGKSKVCIDDICISYEEGEINCAVVVAPKGVYRNWSQLELLKHVPDHIDKDIITWSSANTAKNKKELRKLLVKNDKLKFFVINIEAFRTRKALDFTKKVLELNDCSFAIDESTVIKNPQALQTKNILSLRKLAKQRRILSGLPVTKSPLDLYSQCYFLDPRLLGYESYFAFRARYAVLMQRHTSSHSFQEVVDYKNLDELNKKLETFSSRVLKKDCLDLPDKLYTPRLVELTKDQSDAYEAMKREAMAIIGDDIINVTTVLSQITKLHQIVCGFILNSEGEAQFIENNRYQALLDVLEEAAGQKVVIWANYRHDIKKILKTIREKYGFNSAKAFYGDTKDQERQNIVTEFQDPSNELQYIVANPRTAGYGLTLTIAHTVVYFSNSYDLEIRMQSEERVHRIGQTKKVTYIDLVTPKTVDEKIIKSLRKKINISSEVLGEELKEWIV